MDWPAWTGHGSPSHAQHACSLLPPNAVLCLALPQRNYGWVPCLRCSVAPGTATTSCAACFCRRTWLLSALLVPHMPMLVSHPSIHSPPALSGPACSLLLLAAPAVVTPPSLPAGGEVSAAFATASHCFAYWNPLPTRPGTCLMSTGGPVTDPHADPGAQSAESQGAACSNKHIFPMQSLPHACSHGI